MKESPLVCARHDPASGHVGIVVEGRIGARVKPRVNLLKDFGDRCRGGDILDGIHLSQVDERLRSASLHQSRKRIARFAIVLVLETTPPAFAAEHTAVGDGALGKPGRRLRSPVYGAAIVGAGLLGEKSASRENKQD